MAALVADDIAQQTAVVPQGMGINPIFDWAPILGVPLWLFITCIFLFILAAVFVYWIARIRKLNSVRGWKDSMERAESTDVQVWVITRTLSLIIDCMKIEDSVISYKDPTKIGMWHHNTRESVIRVGGNPAVVVSEDFDQTRDFISEIVLTDNSDVFNADQVSLKKEHEANKDESDVIEPINNYEDYEHHGREALQLVNPEGLPMRCFNVFSNTRFLKYFPHGCSHMLFGADLTLDAKLIDIRGKDKGFWEKYAFPMLAIIVVLIAIVTAWMVPLGAHA